MTGSGQWREHTPLHTTDKIALADHPALIVIDASVLSQAAQILLHYRLALSIVVERKGTSLWSVELKQYQPVHQ